MPVQYLWSGQGIVYAFKRQTNGNPGAGADLGNVPRCELGLEVDKLEKNESRSGKRLLLATLNRKLGGTLTLGMDEVSANNLNYLLQATTTEIAGSTVTNETQALALVAGDYIRAANSDISALVVTDSAGSPVTLTLGTHYEITNAKTGIIKLLNVTGFTQPFKLAYTYGAREQVSMFTNIAPVVSIVVSGINTADDLQRRMRAELYRVRFEPVRNFSFIQDDFGNFELTGSLLYDPTKPEDPLLGQFGNIQLLPT